MFSWGFFFFRGQNPLFFVFCIFRFWLGRERGQRVFPRLGRLFFFLLFSPTSFFCRPKNPGPKKKPGTGKIFPPTGEIFLGKTAFHKRGTFFGGKKRAQLKLGFPPPFFEKSLLGFFFLKTGAPSVLLPPQFPIIFKGGQNFIGQIFLFFFEGLFFSF